MSKDKHRNKDRRMALWWKAAQDDGICVNCKWQQQTSQDRDLRWLLKKGLVRMERTPTTGRKRSGKRQSILTAQNPL
jgi:hypothetical protein